MLGQMRISVGCGDSTGRTWIPAYAGMTFGGVLLPIHPNHFFFTLAEDFVILPHFRKGGDCLFDMVHIMSSRYLHSYSCLTFRDNRIEKADDINTFIV